MVFGLSISYKALQEQDQRSKDKAAMVAQERRERAAVREGTSVSAAKSQTVVESQDELESQQGEVEGRQGVRGGRGAQERSMGTQRDRTGEAFGAADGSSDDDGVWQRRG